VDNTLVREKQITRLQTLKAERDNAQVQAALQAITHCAASRDDILVVGGIIPAQNEDFLLRHGAAAVFGPGTVIPVAAQKILTKLQE
jgi:methylmalonyl-CoA mutase cobalamin-binding domain/chain